MGRVDRGRRLLGGVRDWEGEKGNGCFGRVRDAAVKVRWRAERRVGETRGRLNGFMVFGGCYGRVGTFVLGLFIAALNKWWLSIVFFSAFVGVGVSLRI